MGFVIGLINVLLVVCSLFLICLILIQRGKGGGLAGAFGGVGGSSAFGTKAGDVFTRVTIVTAGIWFLLAMSLVVLNNRTTRASAFDSPTAGTSKERTLPSGSRTKETDGGTSRPAASGTSSDKGSSASPSKAKPSDPSLPPALEGPPAKDEPKPAGKTTP